MKTVAVLGLGRFGRSVAEALMEGGAEVMAVDSDPELVEELSDKVTYAMIADLRDMEDIKSLGISNMDVVVVAMAESLEASIMSIMTAKELGVPKVIAKAANKATADIFRKVGADSIIFPEDETGKRTAHTILSSTFLEFFDVSDSLCIIEMLPKDSWVGKSLKELDLRRKYGANVIAVKEQGETTPVFDPDRPLSKDTPILVLVNKKDVKRLS